MTNEPVCPCESFEHPATPHNLPALTAVRYRAGDFRTFRHALLKPLTDTAGLNLEVNLTAWRPNAQGDLLLQTLEWWAYVADVLTFYNERSLNERLLRTATLDQNVRGLVAILGYRPRPGIAGSASLGILLSSARPLVLPAGFRVQSKPAPGKQPQTFETTRAYNLLPPDTVAAHPPGVLGGADGRLYLEGKVKSLQPGTLLLLTPAGMQSNPLVITIQSVTFSEDAGGNAYTEIVPAGSPSLPVADAGGYRLLTSKRTSGLWKYGTTIDLIASPFELEGVDRVVHSGQAVVLNAPGTSLSPVALMVDGTTEMIWYTNGTDSAAPPPPAIPAGAPHTRVWYSNPINSSVWNAVAFKVQVLLGWEPVGTLRNVPVSSYNGAPPTLIADGRAVFQAGNSKTLLLEGSDGNGALATGSVLASTPVILQIASLGVTPAPVLKTPLRAMENVITLTRGKTVDMEVIGIGDASQAPQEFALTKFPLTYLPAGDSYKSTLRVYVNGVQWTEAKSFYGQPAMATVFVTREDEEQKTHIAFGDWVNGAGLPTGAQVTAAYRIESGAENVAPGGISVISKPVPGVRGIRQPVVAGGGADPDPREQIRKYAPKSVLTFGRAISADDYEAIAVRAPGVTRVRSVFAWSAQEQRATVTLYVGDDTAAVSSARNALLASADPNRQVSVVAATRVRMALLLAIRVNADRILDDVVEQVRAALADPDAGLFGSRATRIGDSIYFSQLSKACLDVAGVDAVTFALFLLERLDPVTGPSPFGFNWALPPRVNALAYEFFSLEPQFLFIFPEVITGV